MPLTVLQIIPELGAGGAEQACVDIAAGLKNRGDRALVVSAGGHRVAELRRVGGDHVRRNVNSKNPVTIIENAVWLADFIRRNDVDVVHVRSRAPAWSAWIASRMTSRKLISTFHSAYKISSPLKKLYNRIMTRADRIIAISHFIAGHILESYGIDKKKIRVVLRGIDLERFSPQNVSETAKATLRNQWEVDRESRIILLPARLSPIKGHKLAIEAMSLLRDFGAIMVVVGDDQGRAAYRRELEALIDEKGLRNRVKLVEHCSDMPAAYSLADLVVVPSLVPEGFGRVPVEAMAMGVPVIASSLGATKETVLEGRTGWLLAPEDPQIWAEKMDAALSMSEADRQFMRNESVKRATELYDSRKMIDETLKIYDELAGKN